jgi:hypothetical protein
MIGLRWQDSTPGKGARTRQSFFTGDFSRPSWKLLFCADPDETNLAEFCTNPYLSE